MKPRIETCLSPALLPLYHIENSIVVIIDIFRATSTIAAAMYNGASAIIPVATVDECIALGNKIPNSITAGERDGKIVEGLKSGNSPLEYPTEIIKNKTLVLTTTNGTRLLHQCHAALQIITGSFLNLDAVCDYLISQQKNILLGCASWKDKYNLEDSLFAGAVYDKLSPYVEMNCDSTRASHYLYSMAKSNLYSFIQNSSHYKRLSAFGLQYDMEYCCNINTHNILVRYENQKLIAS